MIVPSGAQAPPLGFQAAQSGKERRVAHASSEGRWVRVTRDEDEDA